MADRKVHAKTADGIEIVRYDRSGKWYFERQDGTRRPVSVGEAAAVAAEAVKYEPIPAPAGVYLELPGGRRFDAIFRKLHANRSSGDPA